MSEKLGPRPNKYLINYYDACLDLYEVADNDSSMNLTNGTESETVHNYIDYTFERDSNSVSNNNTFGIIRVNTLITPLDYIEASGRVYIPSRTPVVDLYIPTPTDIIDIESEKIIKSFQILASSITLDKQYSNSQYVLGLVSPYFSSIAQAWGFSSLKKPFPYEVYANFDKALQLYEGSISLQKLRDEILIFQDISIFTDRFRLF